MSPLATLLHAWRLRRLRWAMRSLSRQLAAYEADYARLPFADSTQLASGR